MDALLNRTISSFPLSIGTALAFESIFKGTLPVYDPQRQIPDQVDIGTYNSFWINTTTLMRNILGAIPTDAQKRVQPDELAETLQNEVIFIQNLIETQSLQQCQPIFYHATYKKLLKSLFTAQYIKFRTPTTPNQIAYQQLLDKAYTLFEKETSIDLYETNDHLEPTKTNNTALILTHQPYDLTNYKDFMKLDLIESHTGKLKSRKDWATKYYPIPETDMFFLPFTRKLLMIFGDHVLIKPMDIKYRRLILEVGRNNKWTPLTTEAKIRMDMDRQIMEKFLIQVYDRV